MSAMTPILHPYPAYKPSGIDWLGDVPEHWEVVQLGRIGVFSKGSGGTKDDEVPDGIPCVRYGDLYTTHRYFINQTRSYISPARATAYTSIDRGDVLFPTSGETIEEIGKSAVSLMHTPVVCGGDLIIFRPKIPVEPRFMGYALDSPPPPPPPAQTQKSLMGRGITIMHIYSGQLKYLWLPLPPLSEQRAIVRYLDHAADRIQRYVTAKRKLIALLEEEKQAIVNRAVTRGLDLNVRLKPSGVEWLGDVPEHWEVLQLGRFIDLATGFPFKSEGFSFAEEDMRLLRGVNVSPGRLRWMDVVRWPNSDCSTFDDYRMEIGDIVLGMDRPFIEGGVRVASLSENDVPTLLLQRVARIRPRQELSSAFTLLLLAGKSFVDYLTPLFTGISVPHVSPEQIKSFRIALPSIREQNEIVDHIMSVSSSIQLMTERARRQIELLEEYRIRLIADVVTGKLDVREAAAQLPNKADHQGTVEEGNPMADGLDEEIYDAEEEPAIAEEVRI